MDDEVKSRRWNLSVGDPTPYNLEEMLKNDYNDMEKKLYRQGRGQRMTHAEGGTVMQMESMPSWAESSNNSGSMNTKKQGGMIFNVQGADPHNLKNLLRRAEGGDVSKIDDDRGLEGYILGK